MIIVIYIGDKYIGNWENGFQTGEGIMEYHNGDTYKGIYLN